MTRECPICGADNLEQRQGKYVFQWPAGFPLASSEFEGANWDECTACGEILHSPELSERIEAEQYKVEGLLHPREIRGIREKLGLSQVDMAHLLLIGDKTYARWEAGLSMQSKSMDNYIRVAAAGPDILFEFEARRNPLREQQVATYIAQLPTLRAQNDYALAAHGDQLDDETITAIRRELRSRLASG